MIEIDFDEDYHHLISMDLMVLVLAKKKKQQQIHTITEKKTLIVDEYLQILVY